MKSLFAIFATFVTLIANSVSAQNAPDKYIGRYYPAPQLIEVYCAKVNPLPDANKKRRIGFIIGIKTGNQKQPYATPYAVFAKGGQSHKLMIIAKQDGYLNTIYRSRAVLADLTTSARTTPIFAQSNAADRLTFLDLLTILGFQSVTLSDGNGFAHQVHLFAEGNPQCKKAFSEK